MGLETRTVLALIPARGGSKGIPNKNIRSCANKPLIVWTIEAAIGCGSIDKVLVSTDSEEIATVSQSAGAWVPFLRPGTLAADDTSMGAVIEHTVNTVYRITKEMYDYLVLLQPTSPLRTSEHIDAAINLYFSEKRDSKTTLVSIVEASEKAGWLMTKDKNSSYINFCLQDYHNIKQRQLLPKYYYPNGSIFILPISNGCPEIYTEKTVGYVMPEDVSIDIDNLEEFEHAERLLTTKPGTPRE